MDHSYPSSLSIGYLSPGWPLDAFPNGVVSYVADMADQLPRMGHCVTVMAAQVASREPDQQVYDLGRARVSQGLARRILNAFSCRISPQRTEFHAHCRAITAVLARAIAERGVQLFELEESFGFAHWLRRGLSIPVCVRLHGPWFLNGRADRVQEDRAFRHRVIEEGRGISEADAVSAPSLDVLERTRAYYGLALEDAEIIPPPTPPILPSSRWRLDECDPNLILFIGRFDRHKGGDLVIEAFGQVLQDFPQARLCFAGPDRGYTDASGRRWSLDEFLRERLPGRLESGQVEVLGQQPFSTLASLRRKAMVTVVCSRYETFSRVLTETMSVGCPVVAAHRRNGRNHRRRSRRSLPPSSGYRRPSHEDQESSEQPRSCSQVGASGCSDVREAVLP